MLDWIRGELLADGMIAAAELDLLHVTDDPDEAVAIVLARYAERYSDDGSTKYGPGGVLPGP
jgi:hypothetical protein